MVGVYIGRSVYLPLSPSPITSVKCWAKGAEQCSMQLTPLFFTSLAAGAWLAAGPEKMRPIPKGDSGDSVAVSVKSVSCHRPLHPVHPLPRHWIAVLSIDWVWSKYVWSERADQGFFYCHLLALCGKTQLKDYINKYIKQVAQAQVKIMIVAWFLDTARAPIRQTLQPGALLWVLFCTSACKLCVCKE